MGDRKSSRPPYAPPLTQRARITEVQFSSAPFQTSGLGAPWAYGRNLDFWVSGPLGASCRRLLAGSQAKELYWAPEVHAVCQLADERRGGGGGEEKKLG